MNTVSILALPLSTVANFILAAVSFHEEHVLRLKSPAVEFSIQKFKSLNVVQIQPPPLHIGDPQIHSAAKPQPKERSLQAAGGWRGHGVAA